MDEEFGNDVLYLFDFGEPLLHLQIMEMLQYCKARGIRCGLSTNAMLSNEEAAKNLITAGLSELALSLNEYRKETEKNRNLT